MVWVWVPRHTTPLPHIHFFLSRVCAVWVAWCGYLRNPLKNAVCVITNSGVFALLCFALLCFALLCFALLCFALLCFL